jgi:tight adherence protein C
MDPVILLFVLASFLAIAGIAFVVGQYLQTRIDLQRRMPAGVSAAVSSSPSPRSAIGALVSETFTEERFGVDAKLRQKLRRNLLRAGFFNPYAIRYYLFSRFCSVIVLPMTVFLLCEILTPGMQWAFLLLAVMVAAGIGVLGPDVYLSRRQNGLMAEYRLIFPDLLDLLNVCVSAGLSVEASFDRVREHIAKRSRALGRNIDLMGAEMRAGRSTVEALTSFADRLALDEAASFVAVLRHSVELGGDVGESLRVFSEDMRVKRMLLAEKKANELPVKLVMPLALGIFPVILTIVLLPVIVKLSQVLMK